MKNIRTAYLILAVLDVICLGYAVSAFVEVGAFPFTFLLERVSEALEFFSFDNFLFSFLSLAAPLASLLLDCSLLFSIYGFFRGRPWVKWVVLAQLPLRLLDFSPTIPVVETSVAERMAALLPDSMQTRGLIAVLLLLEVGKAVWVFYLSHRQRLSQA